MNDIQIDIVVPTMNSSITLDWTLIGLSKIETPRVSTNVYIIDSGSTDGTQAIADKYGFNVHYYPKGNMYKAINYGLGLGKSPWCSYLNSDDIIYSDEFAEYVKYAEKEMIDIAYGNIDFIDGDGRFLHSWNSPSDGKLDKLFKNKLNPIPQVGTIFRRDVYKKLRGFDEKYKYVADYDFFYRALISGVRYRKYCYKTIAAFRIHENQFTQVKQVQMDDEITEVRKNMEVGGFLKINIYEFMYFKWRNVLNYLVRIIRNYQLNGSLEIIKSTSINKKLDVNCK